MTVISGTIQSVPEVRTRVEPSSPISAGVKAGNLTFTQDCGDYTNTGNVPQTVTVTLSNQVGCVVSNPKFTSGVTTVNGTTVSIDPGKTFSFKVTVVTSSAPIGGSDVPFSFETTAVWA